MKAIVLNRRNWREYDQMISFYSEDNDKIELLARGIKKITSKLSGYLTIGNIVDIEIAQGKEFNYLIQVNPVWVSKEIIGSSVKLHLINYVLETINKLIKVGYIDSKLFYFLVHWLRLVDGAKKINNSILYYFLIYILQILGFIPELDKCYRCGVNDKLNWLDMSGGLICTQCYGKIKHVNLSAINNDQIKVWRKLLNTNQIENFILDNKLGELIYKFFEYHLEKRLIRFKF